MKTKITSFQKWKMLFLFFAILCSSVLTGQNCPEGIIEFETIEEAELWAQENPDCPYFSTNSLTYEFNSESQYSSNDTRMENTNFLRAGESVLIDYYGVNGGAYYSGFFTDAGFVPSVGVVNSTNLSGKDMLVIPTRDPLSISEINNVLSFLNQGKVVVVLSDWSGYYSDNANTILSSIGSTIVTSSGNDLSAFCNVQPVSSAHPYMTGLNGLAFNVNGYISSGGSSIIEIDGVVYAAEESVNGGKVVVISDVETANCSRPENYQFFQNIVAFVDPCATSDLTFNYETTFDACDDATITATATGGVLAQDSDYTWTLDGGPVSLPITDLSDGTYELTVTDDDGCTHSETISIVDGPDEIDPQVICNQNNSATLDANTGTINVDASSFDEGSSDNCGIVKYTFDAAGTQEMKTYSCEDVTGWDLPFIQEPIWVWDAAGNSTQCNGGIRIFDITGPECGLQPMTIELDASGNATILDVDDVNNPPSGTYLATGLDLNSFDHCGIASFDLAVNDYNCDDIGNNEVDLVITDIWGNATTCSALVIVEDNIKPTALCQDLTVALDDNGTAAILPSEINNGSTDNCTDAEDLQLSLDISAFDCSNIGENVVALTVDDGNGNTETCTATVTVQDNTKPTVSCQDLSVELDATGNISVLPNEIDNGSSDNCTDESNLVISLDKSDFSCEDVGANDVILTVIDESGNSETCTAVVTVEDNIDPVAICNDITVELDENGLAEVSGEMIAGSVSIYNSQVTGGDLGVSGFGETYYTTTITSSITLELNWLYNTQDCPGCGVPEGPEWDPFGYHLNGSFIQLTDDNGDYFQSGTFTITLNPGDVFGPQMNTQDNLYNRATGTLVGFDMSGDFDPGNWTLTNNNADGYASINSVVGSYDACGIASYEIDMANFSCDNLGDNDVTVTVTDNNGNVSTCMSTVTIVDNIDPEALCNSFTVNLDANGQATITVDEVDAGSEDNCTIVDRLIDISSFDCSNIGVNIVTLTVTDQSGNTHSCESMVTVEDNILPEALCKSFDLYLDADGNGTLTAADIDNGSSDACGIASYSLSKESFDCSNVGLNSVTLTVTDNNGNSADCMADVNVIDDTAPDCKSQDITVELTQPMGTAVVVNAQDIDDGSSDACGIASYKIRRKQVNIVYVFNPLNDLFVGYNPGNWSSNNVIIDWGYDSGQVLGLDWYDELELNCDDAAQENGVVVELLVTDNNGNSSICDATITVEDNTGPFANCQDEINVSLNNQGYGLILADQNYASWFTDYCGIDEFTINGQSEQLYGCDDLFPDEPLMATFAATDFAGNTTTCMVMVNVKDKIKPTCVAKDITVQLDDTGNASITPADVDGGSTDNCSIISYEIDKDAFTCGDVGVQVVTLTLTDQSGNTSSCTAEVTVEDNVVPVASCKPFTVELDDDGNGVLAASDIDDGSSDACGITLSIDNDDTTWDCSQVGDHTVVLTVTDANGNVSTCDALVTVEDNIAPIVQCSDITVELDANGMAMVTGEMVAGSITIFSNVEVEGGDNGSNSQGQTYFTVAINNPATLALNWNYTTTDNDGASYDPFGYYLNGDFVQLSDDNGDDSQSGSFTLILNPGDVFGPQVNTVDNIVGSAVGTMFGFDFVGDFASENWSLTNINADGNAVINDASSEGSSDNCEIASYEINMPDFDCSHVGDNEVTVTVTDVNGNSSSCMSTVTIVDVTAPTVICQDINVELDVNGNASISASDVDNGSSDVCGIESMNVSPDAFTCGDIGDNTVTLTVTDVNGNSSSCTATVTVEDKMAPTAQCSEVTVFLDDSGIGSVTAEMANNSSYDNCTASEDLIFEIATNEFDCSDIGVAGLTVELTVTDAQGNSSSCNASVTVIDEVAPECMTQDISVALNANGMASIDEDAVNFGSTDACGPLSFDTDINEFTCANLGDNTVTLTVTDGSGNASNCTAIVNVYDDIPPVAVCKDITINLDVNGEATIEAADIENGSTDNCSVIFDLSTLSQSAFDCEHLGANTVTLTVYDQSGNSATCTSIVTVEDHVAPVVNCINNVEVPLNSDGVGFATKYEVVGATFDNCEVVDTVIIGNGQGTDWEGNKVWYDCTDLGYKDVSIRIKDSSGNIEYCNTQVLVKDEIAPTMECKAVTIYLDSEGVAILDPASMDNGSTDNCGPITFTADKTEFSCTDLGNNLVTLTGTDPSGNSASCMHMVIVEDIIEPVVSCIELDTYTLQLDDSGNATLDPSSVDDGSYDNNSCDPLTFTVSPNTFNCLHAGTSQSVTLTVTDDNDNSSSCTTSILVEDNVAPECSTQDITVQLDASGSISIDAADIDNGSSDACGIASMTVSPNSFDCSSVGDNVVTLSVEDVNGNISTCTATVTVEDIMNPECSTQDITVQLDASGSVSIEAADVDGGSSDNCGIASMSVSPSAFTCSNVGDNTVTLTVEDVNGNSSTCTATVTVEDLTAPECNTQDIVIELDENGNVSIVAEDVDNGSSDACGIASMVVAPNTFDCSNIGDNTVTLTVTDVNGQESTCTAMVTVEDNMAPEATCSSVVLSLDASGVGSVTALEAEGGSADNCTAYDDLIFEIADNSFGCADVGSTGLQVELTVTDASGNSSSCMADVIVEDKVSPDVICQNITVALDENGNVSISADDVDAGSSDACGIASMTIDNGNFSCAEIGDNQVTLTVEDNNGNINSCISTVTVIDVTGPTFECPDDIVEYSLTTDCNQNVILPELEPTDVCTGDDLTWSYSAPNIAFLPTGNTYFALFPVGDTEVTASAIDAYGNETTCTFNITVIDNINPTIDGCDDLEYSVSYVDGSCAAIVTWDNDDINANDNCEGYQTGVSVSSDWESGDEFPVGVTEVTFTAIDASGNTATCIATIIVEELLPVADFEYSATSLSVAFADASTEAASWSWDFGDGNTSTDQNPLHTYETSGIYDVCLTVTNVCGSEDQSCQQLEVTEVAGLCADHINIVPGWNLISFDVMPDNSSITAVFGDEIAVPNPNISTIATYDELQGGQSFTAQLPPSFPGQLQNIEEEKGYWVLAENATMISVDGSCLNAVQKPSLNIGWNLIAYLPQDSESPSDFFDPVMSAIEVVSGYDQGGTTYNPNIPFGNSLSSMDNGFGYWVKSTDAIDGDSWGTYNQPPVMPRSNELYDAWGNLKTTSFDFLAGTALGLNEGSIVEVVNTRGEMIIELVSDADGNLAITPIYGDDHTTEMKDGLKVDEEIFFRYNDELSTVTKVFKGDKSLTFVELEFQSSVTNTEEEIVANSFDVYPNPVISNGTLEINLNDAYDFINISLIDNTGRMISQLFKGKLPKGKTLQAFDVKSINSGIYMVQVMSDNKVIHRERILVTK